MGRQSPLEERSCDDVVKLFRNLTPGPLPKRILGQGREGPKFNRQLVLPLGRALFDESFGTFNTVGMAAILRSDLFGMSVRVAQVALQSVPQNPLAGPDRGGELKAIKPAISRAREASELAATTSVMIPSSSARRASSRSLEPINVIRIRAGKGNHLVQVVGATKAGWPIETPGLKKVASGKLLFRAQQLW